MNTLAIIGGGPAGYVAAIIAAQQGKKVILIEQRDLGGTCLNEGCMPTKSLLESADVFDKVKHAEHFGVKLPIDQVSIDWNKVQNYKHLIVNKLVSGIHYLMKKNNIQIIKGSASFLSEHRIQIQDGNKVEEIEASKIIIASGSEPIALPFAPFDGERIIDSRQAMSLHSIPSSIVIVGGGVIGCEFASIYSRMGTRVTIIEMAEQLLPGEDSDIASILQKELEGQGVNIYTATTLKQLNSESHEIVIDLNGETINLKAEYVLVSIGRKPKLTQLGLEKAGVYFTEKGIDVNEHMQTSISHIYACGDVIGGTQLAHVAFHEGTVAALHACGQESRVNYRAVPRCIYTSPEIASVGLNEKQAREKYENIKIGEFPFSANGKALILNEQVGKIKVIVESEYSEIIGVSIIGPKATELIGQGSVMLHAEMTTDIIENFIAAHPTLSEAIHEAFLDSSGHAVHY